MYQSTLSKWDVSFGSYKGKAATCSTDFGSKYKMRSYCFDGSPLGNSRQPERPLFQSWEMENGGKSKGKIRIVSTERGHFVPDFHFHKSLGNRGGRRHALFRGRPQETNVTGWVCNICIQMCISLALRYCCASRLNSTVTTLGDVEGHALSPKCYW